MPQKYDIDYSKWDNLEDSDDDKEPESLPRVTTLENPSSVSMQGDGTVHIHPDNNIEKKKNNSNKNASNSVVARKPGIIDYSKWDHIEDSDSDEEPMPRVTTLEGPSRVSTQEGDGSILIQPSIKDDNDDIEIKEKNHASKDLVKSSKEKIIPKKSSIIPDSWIKDGGVVDYSYSDDNDAKATTTTKLYWSQDRYVVQVRFPIIPKDLASKHIRVKWEGGTIYNYADRFTAVGTDHISNPVHVRVVEKESDEILFSGTLPHPIHFYEDNDELDWSVEYDENDDRIVLLTFAKASPMEALVMKWKRPFLQVKEDNTTATEGQKDFKNTWDIAHEKFREKIKNKQFPYSV